MIGFSSGRGGMRVLAAIVVALGAFAAGAISARAQGAFYSNADPRAAGRAGALIRYQPQWGAPDGAAAYRILYRSTGLRGEPIAVSGFVVVPAGPPPPGGRPIVAWAHPTSGVVPQCAPSLANFRFRSVQGLRDMLSRGYIVAATDYPGLGTAGPHPYLVGVSEGRAVLDSVRAARMLPGAYAGRRFAVWGHSQGGQAALYTGLLAPTYAPDLRLVGVAAAAPATELGVLLGKDFNTTGGKNLTAMTLWSWARVFDAPIDRVVEPAAMPTVNRLANECIESIFDILARERTGRPLDKDFLKVTDLVDIEPWRSLLAENTPGALPPDIPVFLSQGADDHLVLPAVTQDYMSRLCRAGSAVRMLIMPGVTHAFAAKESAGAAVAWIADRFAGAKAPSDCGGK